MAFSAHRKPGMPASRPPTDRQAERRCRPILEVLEDRTLLSSNLLGPPGHFEEKGGVSVMTYNLNEGSDLDPLLGITSPSQIPGAVSQVLAEVDSSNIPERAQALANEIAAAQPTLIGVQEASVWTVNGATRYDLLGDLLNDLAALKQHYAAVVITPPEFANTLPDAHGDVVGLQDHNAILARTDLPARQLTLSDPQAGLFHASLTFPVGGAGGPTATIHRTWASIDATVRGDTFRFVTTHLEALSQAVANAQAAELVAPGGPTDTSLPVVLAGDFNSTPTTAAYGAVTGAGFQDVWTQTHPGAPGFTNGPGGTTGTQLNLTERIDYIFVRGGLQARSMDLFGSDPDVKTPSGLWPSDHLGLVATLELP